MAILILADHDNQSLNAATHKTVTAALQLDTEIHILIAGNNCRAVAEQAARISNVAKILLADSPVFAHALAENLAPFLAEGVKGYSHLLTPATTTGKDILPRVAALLDVAQISDVIRIESADSFVRPIYAGNILATVQSTDTVKLLTIRTTAFDAAKEGGNAAIEVIEGGTESGLSRFISATQTKTERPELTAARVVISGGRGMGSAENFKLLNNVADKLGAAIGASRAAVDAGFVPNDYQVGQTGKVVAPELYIAVGISGAIQHLAGMKDSKVIVAINKDENAPIFEIADYGLVADLFVAVPELEKALS